MPNRRQRQVTELLQEEIGLIVQELSDPHLAFISVTAVEISKDLRHAHVFISSLDKGEETAPVLKALEHATGYVRSQLAESAILRYIPELSFHWDGSQDQGRRIDELLREVGLNQI